jgi:glycosyltransferase involved in cell wall biosynthesis
LFLQICDPAYLPPLIHASSLMADAGWQVTFLAAPFAGALLANPPDERIRVECMKMRPSHVIGKFAYLGYVQRAVRVAARLRPHVIYASDLASCGPALAASRVCGSPIVYHEHDSPDEASIPSALAVLRRALLRRANLIVFPNAERARAVQAKVGFEPGRISVVWNMPRREELRPIIVREMPPLIIHYHGNISPTLLPETVVSALIRMKGAARLQIVGYEAPAAKGYVSRIMRLVTDAGLPEVITYLGAVPRSELFIPAVQAHVGLCLMPMQADDLNLRFMAGASNKAFDYMAAGLALLVPDLPEWREMYVAQGVARAMDPRDESAIVSAMEWFLNNPEKCQFMGNLARTKIDAEWNYDFAFRNVLEQMGSLVESGR